jgi:photosystem II stability/assembly factor-like uncharacterized protein
MKATHVLYSSFFALALALSTASVTSAGVWNYCRAPLSGGFAAGYAPGVFFLPGTNTGWLCGMSNPGPGDSVLINAISRTTDGGRSWVPQSTHPFSELNLNRIFFLDEKHGWTAGPGDFSTGGCPVSMRTTDGGNTWAGQSLPYPDTELYTVHFVDTLTGFVGGQAGLFLRTTDGGVTWVKASGASNMNFLSLHFKDSLQGLASGFDSNYYPSDSCGRIWRTTDGGNFWQEVTIPPSPEIHAMSFLNSQKGWFVPYQPYYNAYCYLTTDGGVTWNPSNSPLPTGMPPTSISFSDSLHGWIAGGYPYPSSGSDIWRSTDGGRNWVKQISTSPNGLWGVSAVSDSEGIAVGFCTILHTTDRGSHWEISNAGNDLWEISAPDTMHLFTCGFNGMFIKSSDGGSSWINSNIDSLRGNLLGSCAFPTRDIGWVGGAGFLEKTTDGGRSWINQNPIGPGQGDFMRVQFLDTLTGWVGGRDAAPSTYFYHTTDGGNFWTRQELPSSNYKVEGFKFVDRMFGWAVGWRDSFSYSYPLILQTTDGGDTWTRQALSYCPQYGNLNACSFISRTHGWAGGAIEQPPTPALFYRTTDGGQTWIWNSSVMNDTGGIENIGLVDSLNGWFETVDQICHSTDGGVSFVKEFESYWGGGNARGITVIDTAHAWVCMDRGFVLEYSSVTTAVGQTVERNLAGRTAFKVFPNPFQGLGTITYGLSQKGEVSLTLYDITGRMRKEIFKGNQKAGDHIYCLDIRDLPSGVYFLRAESSRQSETRKVVVTK